VISCLESSETQYRGIELDFSLSTGGRSELI